MKRTLLFSIALAVFMLFTTADSEAQKWRRHSTLEFGVFLGASNYQGDLVPVMFDPRGTHLNVGILTRYNPSERITFGLSANYGHLSGYDEWYTEADRVERNLHFETVLWEFAGRIDYNLITLGHGRERGTIPYVFAGIAVFKFNPKAQFFYEPNSWQAAAIGPSYAQLESRDGDWVELQPLGTEGQGTTEYNDRKRYSLTQLSVPFGVGTKFRLNKHWTLGLEWGWRLTFTDYIDDVSTYYVEPFFLASTYGPLSAAMSDRGTYQKPEDYNRGNQKENDWYNIFGLTLTYKIYSNRERCFQF